MSQMLCHIDYYYLLFSFCFILEGDANLKPVGFVLIEVLLHFLLLSLHLKVFLYCYILMLVFALSIIHVSVPMQK